MNSITQQINLHNRRLNVKCLAFKDLHYSLCYNLLARAWEIGVRDLGLHNIVSATPRKFYHSHFLFVPLRSLGRRAQGMQIIGPGEIISWVEAQSLQSRSLSRSYFVSEGRSRIDVSKRRRGEERKEGRVFPIRYQRSGMWDFSRESGSGWSCLAEHRY